MKSGFVAVLGAPNVGKSTFINAVLSKKVSIVSPKPQTTRETLDAIYTDKECQLVFIDTPGLFDSSEALDAYMNKSARGAISGADAVVYMVSAAESNTAQDDKTLSTLKFSCPLFIVINKIDLATAPMMEEKLAHFTSSYPNAKIFQLSALTNFGIKDLRDALKFIMKEGPAYFPEGTITDKDRQFFAKEEIRQELLHFLKDEAPHQSAVVIDSFREKDGNCKILATIFVEKPSQQAIVIGKGGEMIKRISMTARRNLMKEWKERVELLIKVAYEPNWRNKADKLKAFGYGKQKGAGE